VQMRDGLMERSRLNLSLQKTESHRIISVTRICHSVINRIPVLLETDHPEAEFAQFCLTAPMGETVQVAADHLKNTDLEAWAEARYQDLRSSKPMDKIMAGILNETVTK